MTFRTDVSVPRITAAEVALLEKTYPNLAAVATIPVIETEEQALTEGAKVAAKDLVRYEYIARLGSVSETDTGWDITFIVAGD